MTRLPPDRELVEARLELLTEALDALEGLEGIRLDEYMDDMVRRSAVERLLCRLVDTAAEINAHIVGKVLSRAPAGQRDSFDQAAEAGVFDRTFAAEIGASAGMRNLLVHEYERVDHRKVHASITLALDQYRRYVEAVLAYLDRGGA